MSTTPIAFLRLTAFTGLALFTLAVGLGGLCGREPGPRPPRTIGYLALPRDYLRTNNREVRFVETATGTVRILDLPDGESLGYASMSAWQDHRGQSQIVGRWVRYQGENQDRLFAASGLVRLEFPGGKVLDRVETPNLPSGPPCWLPGARARVVYSATDGHLYRFDFEPEDGEPTGVDDEFRAGDRRPSRVGWAAEGMGGSPLYFHDVIRPTDPRLADSGLLLASAQIRSARRPDGGSMPADLWWLRLDPNGSTVVEAGPLGPPRSEAVAGPEDDSGDFGRRCPDIVEGAGGPILSYLAHRRGERDWSLHVARLRFEPDGRTPRPLVEPGGPLPGRYEMTPTTFSPDGRAIYAVRRDGEGGPVVVRVPITIPGAELAVGPGL